MRHKTSKGRHASQFQTLIPRNISIVVIAEAVVSPNVHIQKIILRR